MSIFGKQSETLHLHLFFIDRYQVSILNLINILKEIKHDFQVPTLWKNLIQLLTHCWFDDQ